VRKFAAVSLFCVSLALAAGAQDVRSFATSQNLPDSPSAVMAAAAERPRSHRFFDRMNLALTAGNVSAQIADAITTQHLLARSGTVRYESVNGVMTPVTYFYAEANPVARPFATRGWGGAAAYIGLVTAADLSIRYLFHRTNHHRLERAVPVVFGVVSGFAAARNARKY
jgi:hypothetical protein